ncbi:MAG: hypothetical protein MZW92_43395 [Comamonadaceae bacterium]|nr:hypothetical protein [Comamonadaceae bacterium]
MNSTTSRWRAPRWSISVRRRRCTSAIEATLAAREAGALQQAEAALDTLFDAAVLD